jgi:citrate lyase synthetase
LHKEVILKLPKHLKKYRLFNKKDVCIDEKIKDTILYLWKHKIITLGSCQGNKYPSIVISNSYSPWKIKKIKRLIQKVDKREWRIYFPGEVQNLW